MSEFAPTREVIANKKVWKSYALKRVPDKEWPRWRYAHCAKHRFFKKWLPADDEHSEQIQVCCSDARRGTHVIPLFGFLTDGREPAEPTGRPKRAFSTRPYFDGLSGNAMGVPETFVIGSDPSLLRVQRAAPGRLVVLCEGERGQGFYVCDRCGAGFQKITQPHRSPYDRECHGKLSRVALGHEFVSDVLAINFLLPPSGANGAAGSDLELYWTGLALAYALVEGAASVLDVPSVDLHAVIAPSTQTQLPEVVLYDNVPGGAGLVTRLEDPSILSQCFQAARDRVRGGCGCDPSTSCYGCLRSYRNQFAHEKLRRGPCVEYLTGLLRHWKT